MTPKPHRPPRQRGINPTPAAGADLYLPTGVLPEDAFQAIGRLREEARDEIDRLLAFLDATETDADLEPSLGCAEVDPGRLAPSDCGTADDREEDADHEDAATGAEHSPGATRVHDRARQPGCQASRRAQP
ncbi:MAG: hypothetical protein P4L99_05485 [Chthoniobacter sp.]|nr:hypothetical protein [Chthoniobacter sp.]